MCVRVCRPRASALAQAQRASLWNRKGQVGCFLWNRVRGLSWETKNKHDPHSLTQTKGTCVPGAGLAGGPTGQARLCTQETLVGDLPALSVKPQELRPRPATHAAFRFSGAGRGEWSPVGLTWPLGDPARLSVSRARSTWGHLRLPEMAREGLAGQEAALQARPARFQSWFCPPVSFPVWRFSTSSCAPGGPVICGNRTKDACAGRSK